MTIVSLGRLLVCVHTHKDLQPGCIGVQRMCPVHILRRGWKGVQGDDAPVEAIEKLMWKMEVMSSKSPSAWAAALSLLSSTRQEVGAGESSHLLGTFDALLPLSTQV